MKKRFLSIMMALCLALSLLPETALAAEERNTGYADDTVAVAADMVARIGAEGPAAQYYNNLTDAVGAATDGQTITLVADIENASSANIQDGRRLNLDLNGYDVGFARNQRFNIDHGGLNITGSGELYEEEPYYAPVLLYGSNDKNDAKYTTVTVGEQVTLRGWAGLFINQKSTNSGGDNAYGIVATVYGTLESVRDTSGAGGHALYINGTIKGTDGENVPQIVLNRATLKTAAGNGMYLAGYAETTITDSTIISNSEGSTGIEIRAGKLTINGNSSVQGGTGETNIAPNGNGSTTNNVALAVVQHTTKLPTEVTINGGTFTGGAALFEQNAQNNDNEAVAKIKIEVNSGNFTGQIFSQNKTGFITGGTFNTNVSEYCAPGLVAESNEDGIFSITADSDMTVQVQSADGAVKGAYASLADAVANAASGDTLVLLADQIPTAEIAIESGKELTLDLAGHKIIPKNVSIIVKDGLTVKDSSENGKGEIQTGRQIEVDGGSFTLESGKLSFIGLNSGMYIHSDGTAIVNGGEITGTYSPLSGNNTTGDMNIKINGGTITADNGAAIYMPSQGELTITGGTLNGGVSLRMGQVNISGGTINATTSGIDNPGEYYNYSGNVFFPDALYVLNGTYTSGDDNSLSLNITGGTFNCANGKGSAVAIYDLGKVGQKSEVQISEDAILVTNASDRDAYQVLGFDDIGVDTPKPGYGEDALIGQVKTAISGGSFSTQIKKEYCAEDFVPVTTKDDNGMYTVTEKEEDGETVTGLTLEPKNLTLTDGETYQLKAGTTPEGSSLTWTSSNTSVVKVNSSGRVTAVGAGTATIKVEAGQLSLTCKVTVKAAPSSSGSSSSEPSYSPKLDVSDGGSIKVNPRTPEEGDEVTITVDPDSGYEVDEVTVTDRNGREVKVTAERDGTYTFTQPRGRVTISVTFVREGGSTFFSDVPESFWAYDEIAWAYDNGYVNGTSASSFSPNASISRQQVWMILARLSGADPANMSAAREWAVTNGVSDGTTPGGAVTRQQLVALLYRYATLMGYANDQRADLSAYPDAGTVAGYAVEPMQWSVANSIVGGTSNGTLDPTGTATRAQFAVILYRFWDQVG